MVETDTNIHNKSRTPLAAATFGVAASAFQDPANAALYEIKISALVTQSAIPHVALNETLTFNYVIDTNTQATSPGLQYATYPKAAKRFSAKSTQVDSQVIFANDINISNNSDRDFVSINFNQAGQLAHPLSAYFDFYDSPESPANTLTGVSLSEMVTKLSQFANKNITLSGDNFLSFGRAQVQSLQVNTIQLGTIPGDYNGDQKVESGDLAQWKYEYGTEGTPYADFNGDSMVDGSDFLSWQRTYGNTTIPASIPGDFNGDQIVNSADLALWKSEYGMSGNVQSDFNGDLMVDGADLLGWQRAYQNTADVAVLNPASDPSANLIPEPSTLSIAVVAAFVLATARKAIERFSARSKQAV